VVDRGDHVLAGFQSQRQDAGLFAQRGERLGGSEHGVEMLSHQLGTGRRDRKDVALRIHHQDRAALARRPRRQRVLQLTLQRFAWGGEGSGHRGIHHVARDRLGQQRNAQLGVLLGLAAGLYQRDAAHKAERDDEQDDQKRNNRLMKGSPLTSRA
jgi:hypothetical protein